MAYEALETVRLGRLIHLPLLDFFLACEYQRSKSLPNGDPKYYYINHKALKDIRDKDEADGYTLKMALGQKPENPVSAAPVLLLIEEEVGYFLVVFGFHARKALILGRSGGLNLATPEWKSWNGPTLWQKIGQAFGWARYCEHEPKLYEMNWILVCEVSFWYAFSN